MYSRISNLQSTDTERLDNKDTLKEGCLDYLERGNRRDLLGKLWAGCGGIGNEEVIWASCVEEAFLGGRVDGGLGRNLVSGKLPGTHKYDPS